MAMQLGFDALQPELPDFQKAHNTDSICTEQLCTAHTVSQRHSGCLTDISYLWISASVQQEYSTSRLCPNLPDYCHYPLRSPDMHELFLVQQLLPIIFQAAA